MRAGVANQGRIVNDDTGLAELNYSIPPGIIDESKMIWRMRLPIHKFSMHFELYALRELGAEKRGSGNSRVSVLT